MCDNCQDGTYLITGPKTDCCIDVARGRAWPSGGVIHGKRFDPATNRECRLLSVYFEIKATLANITAAKIASNFVEVKFEVPCEYWAWSEGFANLFRGERCDVHCRRGRQTLELQGEQAAENLEAIYSRFGLHVNWVQKGGVA